MTVLGDSGCCGADFNSERTTALGLLTLSFPLLLISSLAFLALAPAAAAIPPLRRVARALNAVRRACLKSIQNGALIPRARCAVAGMLFSRSAALSGFSYRHFNFFLITSIWLIIVAVAFALHAGIRG